MEGEEGAKKRLGIVGRGDIWRGKKEEGYKDGGRGGGGIWRGIKMEISRA